ncbi:sigma 54-interacting transcriptional regulator [Ulvibacter litoralis]|uniref:Magnesium chelatase subunit I n=1 Tax=Ulvibacter litoralis TaxID=227084 RepID=A0A1G7F0T2_9FLAO|nr:sigma 54-interacting transcriptional regulator [Ulvibacter litoralis]GHC53126.1 magnesium chelatase [Ulvibacter litoralis]SDE69543.1 magnesium chelatase subunit I [Ulvibacter litoralis]
MKIENINTFGELKAAGFEYKSVKEELRRNLLQKLMKKETTFEGIHGYEFTVIPELERAILSKHNINLLGLRGQAKTRLARQMLRLLDEYIPLVEGSEINDDPFKPISRFAKNLLSEKGDDTPITWLHRDDRFSEKLATPDVTVADLIGDVDPIKAANLKLTYADDRVIHFGMIPRANRCIFVINELPDLQARIQVALFNILQEGDVQIRGFSMRLPLDIQFVFTANPEDYTNRGSIVTPLKDRIGSQILTHYPENLEIARTITQQETMEAASEKKHVYVPELAKDIIEQISFEARESEFIDAKSGVSARLSITAFQNLLSTAERRALQNGNEKTTVRLGDFIGIIPAITGKVELVYEGEQEGASQVAQQLIADAVKVQFLEYFPKIEKLQKENEPDPYTDLVAWFFEESGFELLDSLTDTEYKAALDRIEPLERLLKLYQPDLEAEDRYFYKEFILWALVEFRKLSKYNLGDGLHFKDVYGSYIQDL